MNKIKELRKSKHLTQTDLAAICNTTTSNVSGWECEKWQPDYKTLIKLADFFGVSVDYLLGREELTPEEKAAGLCLTRKENITPDEDDLLYIYRRLPQAAQRALIEVANSLAGTFGQGEQTNKKA